MRKPLPQNTTFIFSISHPFHPLVERALETYHLPTRGPDPLPPLLWNVGVYVMYPYIALLIRQQVHISDVSVLLACFGLGIIPGQWDERKAFRSLWTRSPGGLALYWLPVTQLSLVGVMILVIALLIVAITLRASLVSKHQQVISNPHI
jgi:predicted MFS family arabinose efflux permease